MKQIKLDDFYRLTGFEYQQKIEQSGVLGLPPEFVKEIIVNNKYYYKITNEFYSELQLNIIKKFLQNIPLNNAAVGFRQNKSYLNLFEPHLGGYFFLRLDLKSGRFNFEVHNR